VERRKNSVKVKQNWGGRELGLPRYWTAVLPNGDSRRKGAASVRLNVRSAIAASPTGRRILEWVDRANFLQVSAKEISEAYRTHIRVACLQNALA